MPPVDEEVDTQPPEKGTTSKSVIGIIYPPPEVRNIVDKTASFVARNGLEFENKIRQNEINNPKFNFLNPNDPYNAYYQHKVKEFKEGRGQEPAAPKGLGLGLSVQQKQQELVKSTEVVVPKEPPPDCEFVADPPSISAFDLDVVKLTAQFVARNGRSFLTNLMNREQRNYQFDFLRPQHSLFNYFTKLVEQYTKILIPPKDLVPKLRRESDNPRVILEQVKYRVDWANFQERERAKVEEEKEKERVSYAQIDWHDFVVVETVDFQPNETGNLPPPTTPDEVGARLLAQERFEDMDEEPDAEAIEMEVESKNREPDAEAIEMEVESGGEEESSDEEESTTKKKQQPPAENNTTSVDRRRRPGGVDTTPQDMEEASDEEEGDDERSGDRPPPPPIPPTGQTTTERGGVPPLPPQPPKEIPQPPPLPPTGDSVLIKKGYNPKAPKPVEGDPSDKFLVSPLTEEKVPADQIQKHIKIALLGSTWKDQQTRQLNEKREHEEVYAAGPAIDSSLKKLAERRTDIFGSGAEETQIGKKIGEEEELKKSDKIIWDGHTASMEKVSQKARENISIEDQIAVIHKVKGLVADEEKEKIGPTPVPKSSSSSGSKPPLPPQPPVTRSQAPPPQEPPKRNPIPPPPKPVSLPPRPIAPPPPRPPVVNMVRPPPPQMMVLPPQPPGPPMAPGPPVMAMHMPPRPPVMPLMRMGGPPQPPPQPPNMRGPPGPPQPHPMKHPAPSSGGGGEGGPPSKKMKTEEDLIPEGEFLAQNPEGVSNFKVSVPALPDKSEWKCKGQMLNLSLPLTDTMSVIKAKIHEAISMPVGKQKLQFEGMFTKDSNTLAFYNIGRNAVVHLQLKERGGRKK